MTRMSTTPRLSERSNAEILLAEQMRQAGIYFEEEYRFSPPRRWRADFVVPGHPVWNGERWLTNRLLVEVDGGAYVAGRHTRGAGFEKDAEKASAAAILGYRVIRCTPRQVDSGQALAWIEAALHPSEKVA